MRGTWLYLDIEKSPKIPLRSCHVSGSLLAKIKNKTKIIKVYIWLFLYSSRLSYFNSKNRFLPIIVVKNVEGTSNS